MAQRFLSMCLTVKFFGGLVNGERVMHKVSIRSTPSGTARVLKSRVPFKIK